MMTNNSKKYAWDAKDYAKNSANQFLWAKELIPKLRLHGNETLLDIGCGDGKITAEIAKCLPKGKVLGIDSSRQMIDLAKAAFPQKDYPNLVYQVMDARKMAFKEEFDVVFSNAALHWILDQKHVLQGINRALKPSGRALLQMGGRGNAGAVLSIFDDLLIEASWKIFFEDFTFPYTFCGAEEYTAMLFEVGLNPLRVELIPKIMKLDGVEGLAGWIRTTWLPYTERVPIENRETFVGEIVRRYIKDHPADCAGIICLDMVRLEVEASKS